jgi:hypothetical protein
MADVFLKTCLRFRVNTQRNGKQIKAVPITGRETSRLPHYLDNRLTDGGEDVSLTRAAIYPPPPGRFLVLISVKG